MTFSYTPKTEKVLDGETVIAEVRGLSFNHIVGLINLNREIAELAFERLGGKDVDKLSDGEINSFTMELLLKAPVFVAQIIAQASGLYDNYSPEDGVETPLDVVMGLPLGVQIAFLEKIMPLTFNAGGGIKKVLALALMASNQQPRQSEG